MGRRRVTQAKWDELGIPKAPQYFAMLLSSDRTTQQDGWDQIYYNVLHSDELEEDYRPLEDNLFDQTQYYVTRELIALMNVAPKNVNILALLNYLVRLQNQVQPNTPKKTVKLAKQIHELIATQATRFIALLDADDRWLRSEARGLLCCFAAHKRLVLAKLREQIASTTDPEERMWMEESIRWLAWELEREQT